MRACGAVRRRARERRRRRRRPHVGHRHRRPGHGRRELDESPRHRCDGYDETDLHRAVGKDVCVECGAHTVRRPSIRVLHPHHSLGIHAHKCAMVSATSCSWAATRASSTRCGAHRARLGGRADKTPLYRRKGPFLASFP